MSPTSWPFTRGRIRRMRLRSSCSAIFRSFYASALRRVGGGTHRAKDVTPMVFVALARNASTLSRHPKDCEE